MLVLVLWDVVSSRRRDLAYSLFSRWADAKLRPSKKDGRLEMDEQRKRRQKFFLLARGTNLLPEASISRSSGSTISVCQSFRKRAGRWSEFSYYATKVCELLAGWSLAKIGEDDGSCCCCCPSAAAVCCSCCVTIVRWNLILASKAHHGK